MLVCVRSTVSTQQIRLLRQVGNEDRCGGAGVVGDATRQARQPLLVARDQKEVVATLRETVRVTTPMPEEAPVITAVPWVTIFRGPRTYVRSDLKPARTSSEKSCGCSQAAKCPPLSSLL
jgi:hypothetical protein